MKKRLSALSAALLLVLLLVFGGCGGTGDGTYRVLVEKSKYFTVSEDGKQTVKKGESAVFTIAFAEGYVYADNSAGAAYADGVLTLKNVRANTYVVVEADAEKTPDVDPPHPKYDVTVTYHANGGTVAGSDGDTYTEGFNRGVYLYPSTPGSKFFKIFSREGYLPLEYNTRADGSGRAFSLGSKVLIDRRHPELYVMWQKESDAELFLYKKATLDGEEFIRLTKYLGTESTVAIPETIGGLPVREIAANCFAENKELQTVVFNKNIRTVKGGAFTNCRALTTVYLCDSVTSINDGTFEGCGALSNLRVIAVMPPVHSIDLLSSIVRRIELLYRKRHANRPNLLFYGGSGMYQSIDGATIDKMTRQLFRVVNLGQNANLSGLFMLDLYSSFVRSDDVLVIAPEYNELLFSNEWHMVDWMAIENFYDAFRYIDLRDYVGVFTAFNSFQNGEDIFNFPPKLRSAERSYDQYNAELDEYFTRNYVAVHDPYQSFDTGIINFSNINNQIDDFDVLLRGKYTDKGALVYWSFPAVYEKAYRNSAWEFEEYTSFLREHLSCPIISDYRAHLYPFEKIYDSVVHLTTEGAKENSRQLCKEIYRQLKADNYFLL